jgi:hypothetical protein
MLHHLHSAAVYIICLLQGVQCHKKPDNYFTVVILFMQLLYHH